MRTKVATIVLVAVAGLHYAQSTAGQVQSVPGPGTGIVTVQGEVDVRRLPPIEVGQRGDWRVSLANAADVRVVNTPAVAIAPPPFLRAGGRYEVSWPGGEREIVHGRTARNRRMGARGRPGPSALAEPGHGKDH